MDYKKMIIEMENDKKELIKIINSIQNPKMARYILGLIKSFIKFRS